MVSRMTCERPASGRRVKPTRRTSRWPRVNAAAGRSRPRGLRRYWGCWGLRRRWGCGGRYLRGRRVSWAWFRCGRWLRAACLRAFGGCRGSDGRRLRGARGRCTGWCRGTRCRRRGRGRGSRRRERLDSLNHGVVKARQGAVLDVQTPRLDSFEQILTLQSQLFSQLMDTRGQRQLLL
jgi:hypothetical protein